MENPVAHISITKTSDLISSPFILVRSDLMRLCKPPEVAAKTRDSMRLDRTPDGACNRMAAPRNTFHIILNPAISRGGVCGFR